MADEIMVTQAMMEAGLAVLEKAARGRPLPRGGFALNSHDMAAAYRAMRPLEPAQPIEDTVAAMKEFAPASNPDLVWPDGCYHVNAVTYEIYRPECRTQETANRR